MSLQMTTRVASLPLAAPFRISRSVEETADVVVVAISAHGATGYGEAAPQEHDGESVASTLRFLDDAAALLGDDPLAFEAIGRRLADGRRAAAARAGIDGALHDLAGKLLGVPVWRLLGLARTGPPTCWTVWLGDPDDMARRADAAAGYRRLKLKLGGGDGLDVERARAVRAVSDVPLTVDVNEGWELDEALDAMAALAELGVEHVEQPLRAGHPDGPELKARAPLPVFADEDCHVLADVAACAERAHGVNVKLQKCGGMREAVRMVHAARALELGLMLGCMVESGLGIAQAAAIAALFDHVDLDGNLLLAADPWRGVALEDGVQVPSDEPGLGVRDALRDLR